MLRLTLVALVLLLTTTELLAQTPRPVRPSVELAYTHTAPSVRLTQDTCFTWSTPAVSRTGDTFTITQSVSPRAGCTGGEAFSTHARLEQVPVGMYRVVYRATAVGMPAIPDYSQEFSVNEIRPAGRSLVVFPVTPVALEPVVARFVLNSPCEFLDGVRPVEGGFAIEVRINPDIDLTNPYVCDAPSEAQVTLGAFAPGTYSLTLRRRASDGGAELGRTQFTVSPTTLGVASEPWPDLSGLWTAADEDPNTAFALIHTLDRNEFGLLRDALVGIWYTYDETGAPAWYYIEANTDGANFGTRMAGTISRYRSTNPTAPSFERIAAGDLVGTIQIRIFREDNPGSISGTLNGRAFDIRVERFRFTRSAWPPPRDTP